MVQIYSEKVTSPKKRKINRTRKKDTERASPIGVLQCFVMPFILDVRLVDEVQGHRGGRLHMIPLLFFCGACLNFYREKDSAIPFRRHR